MTNFTRASYLVTMNAPNARELPRYAFYGDNDTPERLRQVQASASNQFRQAKIGS
jgi:hypothetical protein